MNPDTLLTKFIQHILSTKRRSINAAVTEEVGTRPLFAGAMERMATYLCAIARVPWDSLVSIALSAQQTMHAKGKQCWYKGVACLQREFGNTETMKKGQLRSLVASKHETQWKLSIQEGSRL